MNLLAFLLPLAAASPAPEFTGLALAYRGQSVAVLDGSGWCALRVADQWVPFSARAVGPVSRRLGSDAPVVLATPNVPDTSRGPAAVLTLAPGSPGSGEVTLALPARGVPYFLVDFVATICDVRSADDVASLSRIDELPAPARRYLVELLSIAALESYPPRTSPSDADTPQVQIPVAAARCAKGRACEVWAASVARGLNGPRDP